MEHKGYILQESTGRYFMYFGLHVSKGWTNDVRAAHLFNTIEEAEAKIKNLDEYYQRCIQMDLPTAGIPRDIKILRLSISYVISDDVFKTKITEL